MNKKKIGILHGAINNSGDFLICNRGIKLISEFLSDDKIEFILIERWKSFNEDFDALIILGGPIISKKLHPQAKNIEYYLQKKNIPVICLGLGISGEYFKNYENYFEDEESIVFWKKVFESSRLFSVRDKDTYFVLKQKGIEAQLTGCPAFFDLETLKKRNFSENWTKNSKNIFSVKKVVVTIPNGNINEFNYFRTFFFLFYLKLKSKNKRSEDFTVVFQHEIKPIWNKICARYTHLLGFNVLDASGKGLDEIEIIRNSDIHIGTRLHSNIFFLSLRKPSYLLSVDNRTRGFLSTISTSSDDFTLLGIKRLVDTYVADSKNPMIYNSQISYSFSQICHYFNKMSHFLKNTHKFVQTL